VCNDATAVEAGGGGEEDNGLWKPRPLPPQESQEVAIHFWAQEVEEKPRQLKGTQRESSSAENHAGALKWYDNYRMLVRGHAVAPEPPKHPTIWSIEDCLRCLVERPYCIVDRKGVKSVQEHGGMPSPAQFRKAKYGLQNYFIGSLSLLRQSCPRYASFSGPRSIVDWAPEIESLEERVKRASARDPRPESTVSNNDELTDALLSRVMRFDPSEEQLRMLFSEHVVKGLLAEAERERQPRFQVVKILTAWAAFCSAVYMLMRPENFTNMQLGRIAGVDYDMSMRPAKVSIRKFDGKRKVTALQVGLLSNKNVQEGSKPIVHGAVRAKGLSNCPITAFGLLLYAQYGQEGYFPLPDLATVAGQQTPVCRGNVKVRAPIAYYCECSACLTQCA